jgi:citronellyl-CoA dehydrogenase
MDGGSGVGQCICPPGEQTSMIYAEPHRALMESVTRFVEAEINPHVAAWEQEGIFPAHALFRKMGQNGFLGITKPEAYGGLGLDYSYGLAFCEALGNTQCASRLSTN